VLRPLTMAAAAATLAPLPLTTLHAQARPAAATGAVVTKSFGERGAGPHASLVVRNATVIPGHGGPPAGPYDIRIEGNMITSFHLRPANTAVTQAVRAAGAGVTMIEHHYGYAESSLDGHTQDFPPTYAYDNENARFREAERVWTYANKERLLNAVADSLVKCGVTMLPTRVVYEANRDLLRTTSLPWTDRYTHQVLWNWNLPNPAFHGAYHDDWTSDDEYNWTYACRLKGDLTYEFNKRGGWVAFGTDDNDIWATPGFSTVRELQLQRETGMRTLDVLMSATYNSARTLGEPLLGLVRPGYKADPLIVDGNPAANLKVLYSFGDLTLDRNGAMIRTRGIVHTSKDGVVLENAKLMQEVERLVQASRRRAPAADPVRDPFKVSGGRNSRPSRQEISRRLGRGAHPGQGKREVDLVAQQPQHAARARFALHRQPPEQRPAQQHGVGTHGERLEHVGATADPAVHEERTATRHGVGHLRERARGRHRRVQLTAPMVGDDHATGAVLECQPGVVAAHHALHINGQRGDGL